MRKKMLVLTLVLTCGLLLTAMGGGRTGDFGRAPRVERNFTVSIVDMSGNRIDGEKFSWEGRLHFAGYLGMAQVVIPFEKVRSVSVGEKKDRTVKMHLRLQDGQESTVDMEADSRCYGEAGFGSFMLLMSEIRSITFK